MPMIEKNNIDEFISLLNTETPYPIYSDLAPGHRPRGRNTLTGFNPVKYDLANVHHLLHILSPYLDTMNAELQQGVALNLIELEDYALRYAIPADAPGAPRFSLEGNERGNISAHERMTPRCLAAGMFMFEKRENVIYLTGIDHESGYFKPRIDSLIWPLKMLFATDVFRLAPTLKLFCRDEAQTICYVLNTNHLKTALSGIIPIVSRSTLGLASSCSSSYEAYRIQAESIRQQDRQRQEKESAEAISGKIDSTCSSTKRISQLLTEANMPDMVLCDETSDTEPEKELCQKFKGLNFSKTSAFTPCARSDKAPSALSYLPGTFPLRQAAVRYKVYDTAADSDSLAVKLNASTSKL